MGDVRLTSGEKSDNILFELRTTSTPPIVRIQVL